MSTIFAEFIPCFQIQDFKVYDIIFSFKSKMFLLSEANSNDWCHFYWDSWQNLLLIMNYIFDPGEDKCLINWKSEAALKNFWYQSKGGELLINFQAFNKFLKRNLKFNCPKFFCYNANVHYDDIRTSIATKPLNPSHMKIVQCAL